MTTDPTSSSVSLFQDHYWDVGFLRYYQWRQIPNFLLAAPTVVLIMYGAAVYLRRLILQLRDRAVGGAGVNLALLPYVGHAAFLTCFMVACAHVQASDGFSLKCGAFGIGGICSLLATETGRHEYLF